MRFTLFVAMMAVCLIAIQCTADDASEVNDDLHSPPQLNSGGQTGSGTLDAQKVLGDSGTSQSGAGQEGPPGPPSTDHLTSPGSSGSGVAGGDADKTVTTTTTSTAANADAANPLSEAEQPQRSQGTAQEDQPQGTENHPIQGAGPTHNNSGGVLLNEPKTVTTTKTKPVTELGDKGGAKGDRDRVPDKEHTHQAGPPSTLSTPKADPKQITPTPSRGTVEGEKQNDGGQPSTTPDAGKQVVKDTNTASSRGEEVHAPELPLEPHTETGVSEDLTKTQPAEEQTPPLSVKPQIPPSTTTVKENVTPLVPATSTTTGTNKDTSVNNNPPTTSTAGELKVPAKEPNATTLTVPTNGNKETIPTKQSITSTSEPAKVESTAHLTTLPKLSDALQSLDNKDSSIDTFSLFALAAVASLVVMAVAPTF